MRSRIESIFEWLEEEDPEAIVILNSVKPHVDKTFFYASGLYRGEFENCALIMYPDHTAEMCVSKLESESASKSDIPMDIMEDREELKEWLEEKLSDKKKIGINASELTYKGFEKIQDSTEADIIDVSDAIIEARNRKDEKEIEILDKAGDIASSVAEEITDHISEGMKEFKVAAELSYRMRQKGASGDAFEIIAGSGPNSAEPHYTSGKRELQKGDFLVLDFGALYKRYRSDITRTYIIGEASDRQKKMYSTVLEAQKAALDMIEPGVEGAEVHNAAKEVIDSTEFEGKFIHGLGHSIGLSTHDGSGLSPNVEVTLEPGMVFTVEPGIYISDFGGVRIEDDIVVTEEGYRLLTDADKEMRVL
ncbi:MAG: aminopeptidase P family protein [Candidatus Thermoplasmatota archaeon]|nr:aminopeptidase P family protein [Candidatus Thermoplasmatota archaeon]